MKLTGEGDTAALVRFILVGGSFSLFYAVASAALINYAGTDPFWTSVLLFAACIPFAFLAQQHVAFRAKTLRRGAFAIYTATQVSGIAIVSFITTRFVTYDIFWDTVVMGITVALTTVLNFLIGRFVTFKQPE